MKFFFVFLFPLLSFAEYRVGYGVGAYMGRHQLQVERLSENKKHHVVGLLGYTHDEAMGNIRQAGVSYLYSLDENDYDQIRWTPFMSGLFLTYTDNKHYYTKAAKKYDDPSYYDMTNLRLGLRFATELTFVRKTNQNIHFVLDGALLERALVNFSNNPSEYQIFRYYWSLGISIRFDWPRSAP